MMLKLQLEQGGPAQDLWWSVHLSTNKALCFEILSFVEKKSARVKFKETLLKGYQTLNSRTVGWPMLDQHLPKKNACSILTSGLSKFSTKPRTATVTVFAILAKSEGHLASLFRKLVSKRSLVHCPERVEAKEHVMVLNQTSRRFESHVEDEAPRVVLHVCCLKASWLWTS